MTILQHVVVYKHWDGVNRLAHVGIFNTQFSSGKSNTGISIAAQIAKANWAKKNYEGTGRAANYHESSEHVFDSGFSTMLMNTLPEFWTVEEVTETPVDLETAYSLRTALQAQLVADGYTINANSKAKHSTLTGEKGNHGWGNPVVNAANYTQKKLYDLCDKLTAGMWFAPGVKEKTRTEVYNQLTSPKGTGIMRKGEIHAIFAAVQQ